MDHDSTDHPKPAPRKPRRGRPAGSAARGPALPPTSIPRPRRRGRRRGAAAGGRRGSRRAVAEGPLAVGHAAIENAVRLAPTSPGVYRMLNAGHRRALCRQGQERPQAAVVLCPRQRAAAGAHPAHDRGDRHGRDHLDHDRDRGAAARGQSDQAAAAALQRAAARRQVVSLYPDHRRPLGAADPQTSRRAIAARALFRTVRLTPARSTAPSRRCSARS